MISGETEEESDSGEEEISSADPFEFSKKIPSAAKEILSAVKEIPSAAKEIPSAAKEIPSAAKEFPSTAKEIPSTADEHNTPSLLTNDSRKNRVFTFPSMDTYKPVVFEVGKKANTPKPQNLDTSVSNILNIQNEPKETFRWLNNRMKLLKTVCIDKKQKEFYNFVASMKKNFTDENCSQNLETDFPGLGYVNFSIFDTGSVVLFDAKVIQLLIGFILTSVSEVKSNIFDHFIPNN